MSYCFYPSASMSRGAYAVPLVKHMHGTPTTTAHISSDISSFIHDTGHWEYLRQGIPGCVEERSSCVQFLNRLVTFMWSNS